MIGRPDKLATLTPAPRQDLPIRLYHIASQPDGAQSLFGALNHDYSDADLGSVLGAVLGGGGGLGGLGGLGSGRFAPVPPPP